DPCRSLFRRLRSLFAPQLTDNACVNVTRVVNRFLALTETPLAVEFDPDTLATVGVVPSADALRGQVTTAHPHYDAVRPDVINYLTRFARKSSYTIYRLIPPETQRIPLASMTIREAAYMHSFALTENYVILTEFPLVVNPFNLLLRGRPFIENFRWKPERGT